MKDQSLRHLADNVYAFPGDMRVGRPWVGVVVTNEGTVLVDSGNGPRQAEEIQAALDAISAPPVTHILLTHHHWDHVFGTVAFPGAHVVAHHLTQTHLLRMAEEPWSEEYVEAKAERFPRGDIVTEFMKQAVPDWSTFRAIPASETFDTRYELTLGDTQITMEHVGGQHEPDQAIVHVQPANVLFLGDATYGRAGAKEWNHQALAEALRGFLARGADWYVEGHRSPVRPASFERRIERLEQEEV